jgi:hypothetical protein
MSGRNLTNMDGSSTNVVITNRMEAQLPLEQTQATFLDPILIAMKGLNGFGGAAKVIKVNSSNNALEYADDISENITVSLPLLRTGDDIALKGLSTTFQGAGKVIKINSNNDGLEYADDTSENITVSSPLLRTGDDIALKGLSTTFQGAGKVIKINSNNDGLEYVANDWTLNGSSLYPLATSTNVLIGTATNTNSKKFLVDGTSEFKGQLTIDTTGAELSNGTYTYILPSSSSGTLALTSDIPTNNTELTNGANFITASSSDTLTNKSISYSQLTNTPTIPTNNTELTNGANFITASSSDTLTNKSISYSQLTNTPTIPTNNNQLINGEGYITSNDVIPALKGGTGLSALTQYKFLQVNFAANGYDLVDAPSGSNWTLNSNNLHPTNYATTTVSINTDSVPSGYVFQVQGNQKHNGIIRLGGDLETRNGSNGINYASGNIQKVESNSVAYTYSFPSSSGTFALTESNIKTNNIEAVNESSNTIVSNSSYGWEFRGTGSRYNISFPGNGTYYPFLGTESSNPYFIHINNIGDAYQISGTSTSNLQHLFFGKTVINKELVANVDNASSNGRIGFQNFLAGYSGSIFPTLIAEQQYGYFMSNTTPITGTGGSYDGYWGNGDVGGASDRRLKKNINTIENPIDIIKKLRGVNFEWICENKPKGIQIGYIAQEVKEVIPSIVDFLPTKDECCGEGTFGIRPAKISAILVEGIKAQQEEIETLRTELDNYKSLMDKLINAESFDDFKKNID